MNEHLIGKDSEIKGKLNSYLPDDVIYLSDKIDKPFLNCVVVFSYLNLTRYNFEAKFYSEFTQIDFDSSKRHHFCFILYTTKEDSEAIIEDIKNGEFFTQ